jgi:tRNA(Glu) U13 pseudouridine synthase TruD
LLLRFGLAPESLRPPRGVRLHGARRALRVPVAEWQATRVADVLHLRFALPAGSYASVLVDCLFGPSPADAGAGSTPAADARP